MRHTGRLLYATAAAASVQSVIVTGDRYAAAMQTMLGICAGRAGSVQYGVKFIRHIISPSRFTADHVVAVVGCLPLKFD